MKPLDGISALTLILIASFAIDRVTTWFLLIFSALGVVPDVSESDSANQQSARKSKLQSARKYKLLYFAISALLAILIVWLAELRLLSALGVETAKGHVGWLDAVVTVIVLLGGADRVAKFIDMRSEIRTDSSDGEQVQVSGTLIVEEQPIGKPAPQGR